MQAAASILIVEDEPALASLLSDYLRQAGYTTHTIGEGTTVGAWVRHNNPDLVLLDLMLPGKDGLDVCRELRGFSNVPIFMVTARVEEIDRILGLELGADDYICKPFSPREVVARVRATLRRVQRLAETPESAADSPISVDQERHEIRFQDKLLDLTPVEFRLLATLASQPGRVFSRQQLMDSCYEDHRIVTDRTVDSHVKNIRRKVAEIDSEWQNIRSIYGVGYKLDPE